MYNFFNYVYQRKLIIVYEIHYINTPKTMG